MECPFADNVPMGLGSVTSRTEMNREESRTSFPLSTKPGIATGTKMRGTVLMETDASSYTVRALRREWITGRCCGVWVRKARNSFAFWSRGRKTVGTVSAWVFFSVWAEITRNVASASQLFRFVVRGRRSRGRIMSTSVPVTILFDFYTICQVYSYPITITLFKISSTCRSRSLPIVMPR
jgi:hypothetical protein